LSREIAERRALENIAVVEQKAVGRFVARLREERRGAREADRFVRDVTVIIVRIEVGVEVGQAEEAEP
jgi:hypothetical protein